jgi:stress response protein SCP2
VTVGVDLVRGGNTVVPDLDLQVVVSWQRGITVDACALLLTEDGKVRNDEDFVFYNEPTHASGAVRLLDEQPQSASVAVKLDRVPPTIHRIVIAGSLEKGTFDQVPELAAELAGTATRIRYQVTDIEPVTAMVFGELYRRGDGWKFRAVGQGWASGLGGLATDFGISVEDESVITQAESLRQLQQLVTFAFADDVIEQHEVDGFEAEVQRLGVTGPAVDAMRARLMRGLELSDISLGRLPVITDTMLLLDADEILHLDPPAVYCKTLDGRTRRSAGRVIATNRKLRFLSDSGGHEVLWTKVMELRPEYSTVVLAVTSAKGGGTYEVGDAEHVAAVLSGVLKVSRRTASVSIPSQRDSRAIPQTIKADVWRRDCGACVECKASEYLEFDHVIPWSRGGATSVGNLQLLCRRCNQVKGARL